MALASPGPGTSSTPDIGVDSGRPPPAAAAMFTTAITSTSPVTSAASDLRIAGPPPPHSSPVIRNTSSVPSTTIPRRPIDFSHDITSLAGTPLDSRNVTLDTKTTDALRIRTASEPVSGPFCGEAPARRPVSRVLCRGDAAATVIHLDRRSPDGSCSRPEGWAAHLSPRRTGVAPSYLALLRVEFAAFHSGPEGPASSLWHWSSPLGGRALPATLRCGARTFLTPAGCPASARPSEPPRWPADCRPRLVARSSASPGRTRAGPPAATRSSASLASAVRGRVLGPRHVGRRPALEPGERRLRLGPQRLQLRVLDPPAAVELLDDELRVEEQVDLLARPSRWASSSARTHARPLGDVVGLDAQRLARSSRRAARSDRGRPAREPSISAAPSDAGPGLPRAAPSVRMTRCG